MLLFIYHQWKFIRTHSYDVKPPIIGHYHTRKLINFILFLIFVPVYVCISVYIYTACVSSLRSQRRVLDYLELELQVVNGNQIQIF